MKKSLFTLTAQQKKIMLIASAIFAALAVCYLISRCCFTAEVSVFKDEWDLSGEKAMVDGQPLEAGDEDEKIRVINNIIYEGNFKARNTGKGRITHPDGHILQGVFVNSYLTGMGKETYKSKGVTKDGQFKEGILIEGTLTYQDGEIKQGKFIRERYAHHDYDKQAYVLNGQGKQTCSDGTVKEGIFYRGRLVRGEIIHPGNSKIEKGTFLEGDLLVRGTLSHPAHATFFEGEFDNGQLEGAGTIIHVDGTLGHGNFPEWSVRRSWHNHLS